MTGQTISHYKVLEKLGQGGMGVVYKAEDTRLKRIVALKFLPPDALVNEEERARFLREAQAAASLDHPNICTVYEIDEVDGRPFIAMAFLDGQSLKARIEAGPLKIDDALDLGIQMAQALQEAHAKKVVHRDIKSANVMVSEKGQAKVMDFGLAQLAGQARVTRTGTTVGTPAYMSPEQAQGNPVDHRSDIWSLGVLLYEMVAGQLPFKGSSEFAVVHAIINATPAPITGVRSGVPMELERIVTKVLSKRVGDRYQHADDLRVDLQNLRRDLESGATRRQTTQSGPKATPSLAVLPFANMNRDEENEFFSDGMTDELISALAKIPQIRVVSRTSTFQLKGKTQELREIGEKLQVSMVVEGSVRRAGNRVRVTAQLVSISDGYQLWSERYDREMKDVFDIQDDISRAIVDALKIKLAAAQQSALCGCPTDNLEAYKLYLEGLHHTQRWSLKRGAQCFEQALALDPNYAPAYAGLAGAHFIAAFWGWGDPTELWPKARAAAAKALEIDESQALAHAWMGAFKAYYENDWSGAQRHFDRALELAPGDAMIHWGYSGYLAAQCRLEESRAAIRRAQELDPLSLPINTSAAWNWWHLRQYPRAIEEARRVLDLDPGHVEAHLILGGAYTLESKFDEAIAILERARSLSGDLPAVVGLLGWAHGLAGRRDLAETLLARLKQFGEHRYVALYVGWIYGALGENGPALEWLEKAHEQHDALACFLKVAPPYDHLRAEPRYHALLKKMGLE